MARHDRLGRAISIAGTWRKITVQGPEGHHAVTVPRPSSLTVSLFQLELERREGNRSRSGAVGGVTVASQ